ncbi:MAG: pectate lyase [Brevundimonas sp.]|uniref:pectate lyase n=1 Tax=Brevundimonas sp. TaxID=1871086 RepID=UPI0027337633|nr:pectate lyase [Brevundimonas sp.]MDP3378813.1 pectate lyase [Brevundimonas sp.]
MNDTGINGERNPMTLEMASPKSQQPFAAARARPGAVGLAVMVALFGGMVPGGRAFAQETPAQVLAFPGAEGAGRYAVGGRGGRVLRVTHTGDSGPGSLRAAVEADGPRTIVFDTGGIIRLESPLVIRRGRVTLAGQTAPGGGITLTGQPLIISADDVIVRHIRSRLGAEQAVEEDAISVTRGRRIILDHVSASWSVDETLSVGSRYDPPERGIYDVTVQNSVIAESLNASAHAKGDHGYGSLVRGGYGARISFIGNLWASHRARMPRPGNYNPPEVDAEGPYFEFRGNVFYNWGGAQAGYNADTNSVSTYAFVGNAYLSGPDSTGRWAFEDSDPLAVAWFEANWMDGALPDDPWSLVKDDGGPGTRLIARPDWAGAPPEDPDAWQDQVLSTAGASLPRDAIDARILAGVRDRSGRIIDSPDAVGGLGEIDAGVPWIDSDGDGLPDDWEVAHGSDPSDPADGATDPDGDGYTLLEDWLNARATGTGGC